MALALFAQRPEFVRSHDGRWSLTPEPCAHALRPTVQPSPSPRIDASYDATFERDELASLSYVVVDVETTGTSAWSGDRITEIAAIVVRDGVVAERFETLVNPERSIPPMITHLTHINWEMVKDAPRFRDICEQVVDVLAGPRVRRAQRGIRLALRVGGGAARDGAAAVGTAAVHRAARATRVAAAAQPPARQRRELLRRRDPRAASRRRRRGGDGARAPAAARRGARARLPVLGRSAAPARARAWRGGRTRGVTSAMPRPVDKDTTA